jgi:hypothetical protein
MRAATKWEVTWSVVQEIKKLRKEARRAPSQELSEKIEDLERWLSYFGS